MRCFRRLLAGVALPLVASASCLGGEIDGTHPRVATVLRFRAAQEKGDLEGQRALLSADSREKREPGTGRGSWADWDRFFRSETVLEDAVAEGSTVRTTIREINDWYRLVERPPSRYFITYFFDTEGRIEGTLVHQIPGAPKSSDRLGEFEEWARAEKPGLLGTLMPEGKIVPTLERAKLWKESLLAWRKVRGHPDPLQH